MSSRALRKVQKEKEEQERLQALAHDEEEEDHSDYDITSRPAKPQVSAFALLGNDDDNDDDTRDETNASDDNNGSHGQHAADDDTPPQPATAKARKKKAKKQKKGKAAESIQDREQGDGLDDIDLALKELAGRPTGDHAGLTAAGVDKEAEAMYKLLAVDKEQLHVQNEMRKLFGRVALEDNDDDAQAQVENAQAGLDRRHRRQVQHLGANRGRPHGAGSLALRRNVFIQGKEEWPLAAGGGLGMELVEKRENGEVEYRYVHHRVYQATQEQFEIAVASMDPARLVDLMHKNLCHISTLLQVSELVKSERRHDTAGEALERALFTMGRAVHSTFAKNLAEGKARLDFRRPENRELWLGGWRYMQNLSMRGTWRTVYEWAKLLLALSPEKDPYALWLSIDQYALRCKQDLDYLNLSRNVTLRQAITDMPHVQISQGLADYRSGNESKGQQTLYAAISRFPWFVARLMQELDIDAPPAVWGKQPRNDKEALHAGLYAVRAKDIWNTPEHSALLLETASAVPAGMAPAPEMSGEITLNEARHVILSDIPRLIELVPREFTAQYTSASDPLPPPDSIDSYDARAKLDKSSRRTAQPEDVDALLELLRRQGIFTEAEQPNDEDEVDPAEAMP